MQEKNATVTKLENRKVAGVKPTTSLRPLRVMRRQYVTFLLYYRPTSSIGQFTVFETESKQIVAVGKQFFQRLWIDNGHGQIQILNSVRSVTGITTCKSSFRCRVPTQTEHSIKQLLTNDKCKCIHMAIQNGIKLKLLIGFVTNQQSENGYET